ncbi:hypothetical protein Tco_0850167 [Tanacetum coccineum]
MDKIVKEKKQDYDIPLNYSVMQPLTPQTGHITPPDDDYVAPTTNPMSNKQLNKFEEEFSHITEVAKKEYDNPVIKTYDCETLIRKLLHQVSQSSRETKFQQYYGSNLSFPYPVANHGVHCYSHLHLSQMREGTPYYLANKGGVKLVTQTKTSALIQKLRGNYRDRLDSYSFGSTTIGLIQANPTSLPSQPIGEAIKASNLRRTPPGV